MRDGLYCSDVLPRSRERYFENFHPEALELITRATTLRHSLRKMISIECAVIWAAVLAVERHEAESHLLRRLTGDGVVREYSEWFLDYSNDVVDPIIERDAVYLLPHRCLPTEKALDWGHIVTPSAFLAALIAKHNFEMVTCSPFRRAGIRPEEAYQVLSSGDFFFNRQVAKTTNTERESTLLEERASYLGSWLISSSIAKAVAIELEPSARNCILPIQVARWEDEVRVARSHARRAGCCFLHSFPGPRPWTERAKIVWNLLVRARRIRRRDGTVENPN